MNALIAMPDLTGCPPHGPRLRLGGYVLLPRAASRDARSLSLFQQPINSTIIP
jgi:hypothetical protein